MRRMIMTMIMAVVVTATLSAQRIDNTIIEARILTDKMVEELGLNSWQRKKAYQMNLDYLNGIHSYKDIDAQIWKTGPLEKVCGYRSTIKILFCPFIKLNNG